MMSAAIITKVLRTAYKAGQAILDIYQTDFDVTLKTDNSPLTAADRQSHRIIVRELEKTNIPILSEEGRHIPYAQRKDWSQLWVVDPLDGTKEFIKRNGEFTVNIALIQNQRPVLGVIYAPVVKKLYFAEPDLGAFLLNNVDASGPVPVDWDVLLQQALRLPIDNPDKKHYTIIGSRSHGTPGLEAFVATQRKRYGEIDFIAAGSSLKFCLVAEGQADCYPRLGPTMEWDTAAGQAIAECAGLAVWDYTTSAPLMYNKANLLNPHFIVIGTDALDDIKADL